MSDPATGDVRIVIDSTGTRMACDGLAGPAIADDDHGQWSALRGDAARARQVVVVIADDATFTLTLPALPRDDAELSGMLDAWAPLRRRDLVWTHAFTTGEGTAPSVVLVRRVWFEQRIRAITAKLPVKQLTITDERGQLFLLPRSPGIGRGKFAVPAMLVLLVLAMLGGLWWFDGLRAEHSQQQNVGVQARALADPPQTLPPAAAPIRSPGPAVAPPTTAATPTAQSRHSATDIVLIGVVGRIPGDAQVLVRPAWGKTVTLRIGDSLLGWRLVAIGQDRATFDRAGERAQIRIKPR